MSRVIKDGDTIQVHYTGTLKDGTVFDSSKEREPLEFTLGEGQLIPGFEKAVIGMSEGDSTSVDIPSGEAYGDRRDDLELEVELDELPDELEAKVGAQLQVRQNDSGRAIPVTITNITDEKATLDANHPLAGKDLTFDIEVINIGS